MCSGGKVANGASASGAAITPASTAITPASTATAPATTAATAFPGDRI
jgi:hypothetical protein